MTLRQVITINGSIKAVGLDLSSGGLYVHTGRYFMPGSSLKVSLDLFGDPVDVQVRVQHAKESIGMGLQFLDLPPSQQLKIDKLVDAKVGRSAVASSVKKVLIVDDNATVRRMNQSKLVADGFPVVEASGGAEAFAVLARENIQLVILDLTREQMDGYAFLSAMRRKPEWSKIPVLAFSSRSAPADIDKALKAGATEFLPRMTTSPAKLSARVKLHFSNKS